MSFLHFYLCSKGKYFVLRTNSYNTWYFNKRESNAPGLTIKPHTGRGCIALRGQVEGEGGKALWVPPLGPLLLFPASQCSTSTGPQRGCPLPHLTPPLSPPNNNQCLTHLLFNQVRTHQAPSQSPETTRATPTSPAPSARLSRPESRPSLTTCPMTLLGPRLRRPHGSASFWPSRVPPQIHSPSALARC